MILKKVDGLWLGEFKTFKAAKAVPEDFKSAPIYAKDCNIDAVLTVMHAVKQKYLRSIAAPGKRCMLNDNEYVIMEVYDHYLVSDGKGPLQGFDVLDWIEGSEW